MCSIQAFGGGIFDCQSGQVSPGTADLLLGGTNGAFYCRFTVSDWSAAHGTAALTSFITGNTIAAIDTH